MSGLVINTNTAANIAALDLDNNNTALQSSLQKLSSGLQINSAADNPAGLVISQQFQAQIAGVTQATSNDQQAINMVQTGEGALDEMNNLLNSARQLAVDAANTGVNDPASLAADQAELDNINSSIDSIAKNTQFNSKNLLDGTLSNSQVVNSQEVTNFTSTGLKNGTYGIQIISGDAGVVATGATSAVSSANETSLFGITETPSTLNPSTLTLTGTFTTTTTLSISSGVTSQAVNVQITSGTTLQSALQQLNAAANGISVTFATGGSVAALSGQASFSINATDAGDYANGATFTMTNALVGGSFGGAGQTVIGSGGYTAATASVADTQFSGMFGTNLTASATITGSNATLSGMFGAQFTSGTAVSGTAVLSGSAVFTIASGTAGFTGGTFTFTSGTALNTDIAAVNAGQSLFTLAFNSGTQSFSLTAAAGGTGGNGMTLTISGGAGFAFAATGATIAGGTNPDVTTSNSFITGVTITIASGSGGFTGGTFTITSGTTIASALSTINSSQANFTLSLSSSGNSFVITADAGTAGYNGATISISGTAAGGIAAATTGTLAGGTGNVGQEGVATQALLVTSGGTAVFSVAAVSHQGGTFVFPVSSSVPNSTGTATITTTNTLVQTTGTYTDAVSVDAGAVFQIGGNQGQTASVVIQNMAASNLGLNSTGTSTNPNIATVSMQTLTDQQYLVNGNAQDAIQVIDKAINDVTTTRGALGAFQTDTLQSTLNSLNTANENLTSAESTIEDTDFASESANFTKENILVQASTAMLAQANQLPQGVLKLLG
jgi:flagellin